MGDAAEGNSNRGTSGEVPVENNPRVEVSVEENPSRDDVRLKKPILASVVAALKSFFNLILSWSPWVSLVSVAFSSITTGLKFDNKTINAIGIVLQVIVAIYAIADKRRAQ